MKRYAIIELNSWHRETIPIACKTIEKIKADLVIFTKPENTTSYFLNNYRTESFSFRSAISNDVIFFNTMENPKELFLALIFRILGKKVEAIIHNPILLEAPLKSNYSKKRKLMYFLCSGIIKKALTKRYSLSEEFCVKNNNYTRLDFQNAYKNLMSSKLTRVINIYGVLGSVDFRKRNYAHIIEFLKGNKNLKVKILGNINYSDGPKFRDQLKQLGIDHQVIIFDHYLTDKEFLFELCTCEKALMISKPDEYNYGKTSATEIICKALNMSFIKFK